MKYIINSLSVNTFGDPENIPVIFVHGFPFDYTMWENQITALKNDYYCISYDVRGLGDSYVGDGQYTMDAFASDLFSIVHEMNINQPVLCGLSMGGYNITSHRNEYQSACFVRTFDGRLYYFKNTPARFKKVQGSGFMQH